MTEEQGGERLWTTGIKQGVEQGMKNMKRLVTLLLAAVMALSVIGVGCAAGDKTRFEDVPADADYAQAVDWCAENGLMNGWRQTL